MRGEAEELPPEAKEKLPPRAQTMFRETLKRAREAAGSEDEAERMAWEAVERKYGPREGMRLWVRKDWRGAGQKSPRGQLAPPDSPQRRMARIERDRHAKVEKASAKRRGRKAASPRARAGRATAGGPFSPPKAGRNARSARPTRARPAPRSTTVVHNVGTPRTKPRERLPSRSERTLGEEPRTRKGLPQRRPAGRRA